MDINKKEHIVTKIKKCNKEIEKCDKEIRDTNIGIFISVVIALYIFINCLRVPSTSQWAPAIRFFCSIFLSICTGDIITSSSRKNKLKMKKIGLNDMLKIYKLERNGNLIEYDAVDNNYYK